VARVSVTVNGNAREAEVEPRTLLVYFLRETLGLTGTNVGCDTSSCGACTVLLDGESVKSCTLLAVQVEGREVTTIEGLATDGEMHPIQDAFHRNHGHVLARGVHSRLGRFVRAENGYAYTVTGGFAPYRDAGYFLAAADTEPETTSATVSGMLSVLREMREHEVTPEELAEAKAYVAGAQVVLEETPLRRLNRRLRRELSGWEDAAGGSADETNPAAVTDAAATAAVTAADVRRVTQQYVDPARLKIVVVGPADAVAEPLRKIAPLVRVVRGGEKERVGG